MSSLVLSIPKCPANGSSWCRLMSSVRMISGTNGSPWWCSTPSISVQPSCSSSVALSFGLLHPTPAALLASTSFHRYWPYKDFRRLVRFETCLKNDAAGGAREYRRWGLGGAAITWLRCWDLKGWPSWGRTADDEKFECFWLEAFLLHRGFSGGSKIERLQLHWPCLNNSRFENDISIAPGPTWPDKSLSSSYPWTGKGCYGWLGQGLHVCSPLGSGARSWRLQQWPKAQHRKFRIKFQQGSSS